MSLLKRLIQSGDCVLYADYRSGSKDDIEQRFSGTLSNNKMDGGGIHNPDNGKVSYPHTGDIATLTSFSVIIVADFKKVGAGQYLRPVSKRSVAGNHFDLSVDASNITFNNGVSTLSKAIDLEDARSLGFVYDDGSSVSYYKNGISNGTPMSVVSNISAYNTPLTVGSSNLSNNNYGRYLVRACAVFNKVLTATEVAQLTAELEIAGMPNLVSSFASVYTPCYATSVSGEQLRVPKITEAFAAGTNDFELEFDVKLPTDIATLDGSIGFNYGGGGSTRFGFFYDAVKLYAVLDFSGVLTKSLTVVSTPYTNNTWHTVRLVADRDGDLEFYIDGVKVNNIDISSASSYNHTGWSNDFRVGAYGSSGNAALVSGNKNLFKNVALTIGSTVYSWPLNGTVADENGGQDLTKTGGEFTHDYIPDIYFKGEMNITANEVTTTSGYLENSDITVESGSFKVIEETALGARCKVIECVSTGILEITTANSSLSGWSRYVDTGAGYTRVTSDLSVAKTISLTTGDKIIYASENDKLALYEEA